MRKRSFQKSYDVKTFLNKKKSGSRFLFLTFTNTGAGVFPGIAALIIFATISYNLILGSGLYTRLVVYAVNNTSFLWSAKKAGNGFNIGSFLIMSTSPVIELKETPRRVKTSPKKPKQSEQVKIKKQTVYTNGVEVKNETDFHIDIPTLLRENLKPCADNFKVLIVHTHGSESYTPDEKHYYINSGNYRTQNAEFNVIRVGEELRKALESKGIEVIHDKTINDYPSYNDSYNKTEQVIKKNITENEGIAFVFDIHRDAVGTGKSVVKFTTETHGKTVAQVMTVCGTDTNLENPLWRENFKLAAHIQDYFSRSYPGFLRPINLRKERFNMHLTTGSLLFEIGTNGNTLEEALGGAKILGEGLGEFFNIMKNS